MDFVEICNVYVGKMIIKAANRILNSDKICCSYSDFNFGVTFFGTQCICWWGRPFVPEILGQINRVGAKSPIFDLVSPVAVTPSEKKFN